MARDPVVLRRTPAPGTSRAQPGVSSLEFRDLPPLPRQLWRIVGPGVVAAGVGVSSGEFVLWPYIASQAGLTFLWGAVVGVVTQFFLNMEIERYTLATGETALGGFNRFWKGWGLVFAGMVYFANLWPGWAVSSATLASYVFGGSPRLLAVGALLLIGLALTLAPVVYVAMERLIFAKVAAVAVLGVLSIAFAIQADAWRALPAGLVAFGTFPQDLGFALLMGAIAFAGAGGGQNLCQSNWIRDKGFAMGAYMPRLVSPLTGREEAAPGVRRFSFEPTVENLARWRQWWRFANLEQAVTFAGVTIATICFTSMLAYSVLSGERDLPSDITFLRIEGDRLNAIVAPWFGVLFWSIGAFSLFASSMGITDYTSRIAADVLKSTWLRDAAVSESRVYGWLVWGLVALGCAILLLGLDQPLPLLVISACTGGIMMCLYSILLLRLNRRQLPHEIRIGGFRAGALVWAFVFFGVLAALTIRQQVGSLLR